MCDGLLEARTLGQMEKGDAEHQQMGWRNPQSRYTVYPDPLSDGPLASPLTDGPRSDWTYLETLFLTKPYESSPLHRG